MFEKLNRDVDTLRESGARFLRELKEFNEIKVKVDTDKPPPRRLIGPPRREE